MKPRLTRLQLLRQERHPLVALVSLAFVVRLALLVLASALTPDAGLAAGLASLCQPSKQEQTLPGAHDPLACQCGPVCAHGCAGAPSVATDLLSPDPRRTAGSAFLTAPGQASVLPRPSRTAAIRAPPLVLS